MGHKTGIVITLSEIILSDPFAHSVISNYSLKTSIGGPIEKRTLAVKQKKTVPKIKNLKGGG